MSGAPGFMSHRSMWLGPPNKKIKTHELRRCRADGDTEGAAARNSASPAVDRPRSESPPTHSISRRVKIRPVGQQRCGENESMVESLSPAMAPLAIAFQ